MMFLCPGDLSKNKNLRSGRGGKNWKRVRQKYHSLVAFSTNTSKRKSLISSSSSSLLPSSFTGHKDMIFPLSLLVEHAQNFHEHNVLARYHVVVILYQEYKLFENLASF
jgi:hypothetical protein